MEIYKLVNRDNIHCTFNCKHILLDDKTKSCLCKISYELQDESIFDLALLGFICPYFEMED